MTDATHFTNFDYVVIAVMVFSCVFAFFRGLVREILSLIAWVGAGAVTIYYFPGASERLQQHFRSPTVAAMIAGIGIYMAALIGFGLINMVIVKSFKSSGESGMLDNMLGLLFGAARGALMVSLGFFLLSIALPAKEYPDWLTQSVTRPYVGKGAVMLAKFAPDALRDIASLEKNTQTAVQNRNNAPVVPYDAANPSSSAMPGNAATNNTMAPAAGGDESTGYTRATTQQMDRLIQSTGNQ